MSVCTNCLLARWEFLLANIRAFLGSGGRKVVPDLQSVALEQGFQAQKIIILTTSTSQHQIYFRETERR